MTIRAPIFPKHKGKVEHKKPRGHLGFSSLSSTDFSPLISLDPAYDERANIKTDTTRGKKNPSEMYFLAYICFASLRHRIIGRRAASAESVGQHIHAHGLYPSRNRPVETKTTIFHRVNYVYTFPTGTDGAVADSYNEENEGREGTYTSVCKRGSRRRSTGVPRKTKKRSNLYASSSTTTREFRGNVAI